MRKYSKHSADNVFANLNRSFKHIAIGDNVNFIDDNLKLLHGRVKTKWHGSNPRLVIVDDMGKLHYLRDLSGISIFHKDLGGYIPAAAHGSLYV